MNKHESALRDFQATIDHHLHLYLAASDDVPANLAKAMAYSVMAGGKRLRPVLALAAADLVGGDWKKALPVAIAIELIHTYSLIHDDLPAMDNDDFRRGKPTSHRVFGEALAILAGDALLTGAFELLAEHSPDQFTPRTALHIIRIVAQAAGKTGMIAGQAADIESSIETCSPDLVEYIHLRKTAALLKAAVMAGALTNMASADQMRQLESFGLHFGLAFQIQDDILDVTQTTEILGKPAGSDQNNNKLTSVTVWGVEHSRRIAEQHYQEAIAALTGFDEKADFLRYLADYCIRRNL